MATSTTIKARRLLSDLFLEGVEVRFGKDEQGGPFGKVGPFLDSMGNRAACPENQVAVFIRPPDPLQRESAMREANAKRARALVKAKRDDDSEERLTILAFLADMGPETLIDYVIAGDLHKRRAEAEREVLALKEWEDMAAYQDAARQFEEMSEEDREADPEWSAFKALDEKYSSQVMGRERELADAQREALRMQVNSGHRAQIEQKALERRAELVGTQAFIDEYELQMQFFSVRDLDNPNELFFENAEEMSRQPDIVRETISEALLPFINDVETAKNSQGVASGSEPSEPPKKQETSESSTPVVQNG